MSATVSSTISARVSAGITTQITTSIGKKIVMAITGFVSFGYVVGHMLGNLQIYLGQDQLNAYAEFLHSLGPMLWAIRAVLFISFVLHIWLGIQLKLENWQSRPVGYRVKDTVEATLASRTMIYTGLLVLAFVAYHVLHFTVRVTNPAYVTLADGQGRFDAYSMVILGFQNYWISGLYIIAMFMVAYHLSHSFSSMFQTMGWSNQRSKKALEVLSALIAIVLFVGFVSIPVTILAGLITLPGGMR
ncbi:MAG TPA: succinate dehydrogenase cytochrome b subunit [Acidobacteriota bacterium]|nr:succinate dehydrogenase cytochrome b subunit [Acidobacteriota bacterium]